MPRTAEARAEETSKSPKVKTVREFLETEGILEEVKELLPDIGLNVELRPGEIAHLSRLLKEQEGSALAVHLLAAYIRQRIMSMRLRLILGAARDIGEKVAGNGSGRFQALFKLIAGFRERFAEHTDPPPE